MGRYSRIDTEDRYRRTDTGGQIQEDRYSEQTPKAETGQQIQGEKK